MNTFLVFSTIVIIFGGECFQGINGDGGNNGFSVETKNVMYLLINVIKLF